MRPFIRVTNEICKESGNPDMLQMKLSWSKLGHLLEWLGAIYFIGFAIFGAVSLLVLIPRYQSGFFQTGQAGIFTRLEEIIGPLVLLFLVISAASWYQGRGGQGVKAAEVTARTGKIMSARAVPNEKEDLIITANSGQVIKLPISDVPALGRQTQGVILMRFSEKGDYVTSAATLLPEDKVAEELPAPSRKKSVPIATGIPEKK